MYFGVYSSSPLTYTCFFSILCKGLSCGGNIMSIGRGISDGTGRQMQIYKVYIYIYSISNHISVNV